MVSERAAAEHFGLNRTAIHRVYEDLTVSGLIRRDGGSYAYIVNDLNSFYYGQCIGLAIPEKFSEYIIFWQYMKARLHLYLGITERAAELGLSILPVKFPARDADRRTLREFQRDKLPALIGIIYLGERNLYENIALDWIWSNRMIPQVCLLMHNKYAHCGCVTFDFPEAIRAVAGHFRRFGHRKLAVFLPKAATPVRLHYDVGTADDILFHFAACGMDVRREWLKEVVDTSDESIGAALGELMASAGHPRAIWCQTDRCAVALMRRLRCMGRECPRDYSIIGMDDMEYADGTPPLTTVHIPFYGCGRAAVDKLLEIRSAGNRNMATTRLSPTLIVRESVGPNKE